MNTTAKTACQCFLTLCSLLLMKQGFSQDSSEHRFTEMFSQQYDFFSGDALAHPLMPAEEYAIISASYRQEKGRFIVRQASPAEEFITFKTKGTRHLKGFKVSGVFTYTHIERDSVGYILGNYNLVSPYYFYSEAKGNWEVSKYDLSGMVSKSFADDRLSITLGGTFNAGNAWRSNDPRMEEFMHNLEGGLALHYHLNSTHTLGVKGSFGSQARENSNEYRNKDYQSNLQNLPYINYISYGYGLNTIQTTGRQMNYFSEALGVGGVYHGRFDAGTLTVIGEAGSQSSRLLRKANEAASANYRYGSFEEETRSASLMWQSKPKTNGRWSLVGHYSGHFGKDYNTVLKGNNYVYYHNELKAQPIYSFLKNGRIRSEIGFEVARSRLYQADGTTDHRADYVSSSAGVMGALYVPAGKTGFLKLLAGASQKWSDRAGLTVPESQENDFSRGIAYFDYYYYGAKVNNFKIEALYNFFVKNTSFFVKGDYTWQHAKLPESGHTPYELPGTKRETICLSLGFIL